jgi:predicted DNA binding CopG/RHH family protein
MTAELETQVETASLATKTAAETRWQDRRSVQLTISRAVYRRMRQRARAEGLPFATWLVRLALRELRRKPVI